MRRCKVCGRIMRLNKKDRYELVKYSPAVRMGLASPTILECFDCPKCGCQNMVNVREDGERNNK